MRGMSDTDQVTPSNETMYQYKQSERWPRSYTPSKGAPKKYKPPFGKRLRTLHAILRTALDVESKMVLIGYAAALNEKRKDWAVWPSERELAAFCSLARNTVRARKHGLITMQVLLPCWPHPLQRKGFEGGLSTTVLVNIAKLEALAIAAMTLPENARVARMAARVTRMAAAA
jgi:hypothetical protein